MIVSELIKELVKLPPNAIVVTEGYEDGYDSVKKVSMILVKERKNKNWYYGFYEASKNPNDMNVVLLYSGTKDEK